MRVHVLVDFMHIYYKYFFQLKANNIKRLSTAIDVRGTRIEKDISLIYYSLRNIESIRAQLETAGHTVIMSICMDSPSIRNELGGGEEYKANRTKNLSDADYEDIELLLEIASQAGHNIYKYQGYEADDIVNYLIRHYKDDFDFNVIYTNDKDLLINIGNNVGVNRFKSTKGYEHVDMSNYEAYVEAEFGVHIPYNMLGLFLASSGDSSDKIKGITKFGPKSFGKMLMKLMDNNKQIEMNKCGDYNYLREVAKGCKDILKPEQYKELLIGLELVSNIDIHEKVNYPEKISTRELREKAYIPYNMVSIIP